MATLKNTTINDTGSIAVPVGTTAQRGSPPASGYVRHNTQRNSLEASSSSSQWKTTATNELTSNLIFELDARNFPTSNRTALWTQAGRDGNQYSNGWTLGSGGIDEFSQNGNTGENERVRDLDPWNNYAVLWQTRASGDGNADGGWNGPGISCNVGYLYRVSIWMKRTSSSSGGTFYHGTSGGTQCLRRVSDSGEECNPYWECSGTGSYSQNQWYLHVSHIFPYHYSRTARHPDTGVYTIESGKVQYANGCNVGEDVKFAVGTTSMSQRVYHYYCGDSTTRMYFFDPRIELCDGTQPSVQGLLSGNTTRWLDSSGRGNHAWLMNWPVWNSGGWFNFDGLQDHAIIKNIDLRQNWSLECWVRFDTVSGFGFFGMGPTAVSQGLHILYYSSTAIRFGMYGNDSDVTGLTTNTGQWYQYVFTYDHSNPTAATSKRVYRDGVEIATTVASGPAAWIQPPDELRIGMTYNQAQGYSSPSDGQWAIARMYNKVLSSQEVLQNFETNRGRFGI